MLTSHNDNPKVKSGSCRWTLLSATATATATATIIMAATSHLGAKLHIPNPNQNKNKNKNWSSAAAAILYHYPCPDGAFAALAAHLYFKATSLSSLFFPNTVYRPLRWPFPLPPLLLLLFLLLIIDASFQFSGQKIFLWMKSVIFTF